MKLLVKSQKFRKNLRMMIYKGRKIKLGFLIHRLFILGEKIMMLEM